MQIAKQCKTLACHKPLLISVAIKARAEQTRLFCRGVATKRNEVYLKEGLGGL